VKSGKDRAWDTMLEGIVRIRNAKKTNDWSVIQDEFDEVNRLVEKSKMLITQNGIPKFYIKMIAEVEEHLWATMKDKDLMKNVKPVIGRAINRMKLTIKKHNKNYEEQIADYRANPEKYEEEVVAEDDSSDDDDSDDDEEDDDSDSDSDSDEEEKPKSKPKVRKVIYRSDS
jgi:translation initiation factor 3 subunit C